MKHTLQSIREQFLQFFEKKGHLVQKSYPLVPAEDPTLLFVNAGMAPLKNFFLGLAQPPAQTMATCQKCLRVGGKHNDLEQIGYTKRHHTFFEMLGNFSFAGYFKEDAIRYAWEFFTQVLELDKSRLYVTVHPTDEEAYKTWSELIEEHRITKMEENFWFMGDEGPCGPCTEIFYDLGDHLEGAQPGKGVEGDRYLEIWNLVFMMYEQAADGSRKELPGKCVDTGIGLERLTAVLNNVDDTFLIPDLLMLTDYVVKKTGIALEPAHKVLADHARSVAFLLADGVMPGAEGRAYILRKLIRRAARFGHKLGNARLLEELLPLVVENMKKSYPELEKSSAFAMEVIKGENDRFITILEQGMQKVEQELEKTKHFSGEFAFKLYDTFGFPLEILNDVARENHATVDLQGFEKCIAEQKERSKGAWHGTGDQRGNVDVSDISSTDFQGYTHNQLSAKILALFKDGELVEKAGANEEIQFVLDQTPFYGESGGQIADTGLIRTDGFEAEVKDVKIMPNKVYLHKMLVKTGEIKIGDYVNCEIDVSRRNQLRKYHTLTHLLHAALRQVLGNHIIQKGSLVEPTRLRFDFAHTQALNSDEIDQIEQLVNKWIDQNLDVSTMLQDSEQAIKDGAMALFGEKYPDKVRVVKVGSSVQDKLNDCSVNMYADQPQVNVSMELCGGTHVSSTGIIGPFKIIKESSSASGIRRIEAMCGADLVSYLSEDVTLIEEICKQLKSDRSGLLAKVDKLRQGTKSKKTEFELKKIENDCVIGVVYVDVEAKDLAGTTKQIEKQNKDVNALLVFSQSQGNSVSFVLKFDEKAQEIFGSANAYLRSLDNVRGGGSAFLVQGVIDKDRTLWLETELAKK